MLSSCTLLEYFLLGVKEQPIRVPTNVALIGIRIIVFNNFNNISFISWQSILLMEETKVHGENHRLVASHWQTLSHNVVSSTPRHERDSNSQF